MRGKGAIVACVALALLAGGCDPTEMRYFREGAGVNLYDSEALDVAQLQDAYLGVMCHQAGLPGGFDNGVPACSIPAIGSPEWMLIVQAGMNDIDRRCDGWLTWLDNKSRWTGPIHQQIINTQIATQAILGYTLANPTLAINVVGAAFGFASNSFTAFNSRLLFQLEKSTVQGLVLQRQQDFRNDLPKIINNRPAAVYALRQYLRLCMPITIETQVNTTVKVFESGGAAALGQSRPMINGGSVQTAVTGPVIRPDRPPPVTPPPPQVMGGVLSRVEGVISLASGKAIQRALCVSETGTFDAPTRAALKDFKAASLYPTDAQATDILETDADLRRLRSSQRQFPSCQSAGLRNAYEVGLFARFGAKKMRADLALALEAAGLPVPAGLTSATGAIADNAVRQAITALRQKYGLSGQPVIDRTFYDTMLNSVTR